MQIFMARFQFPLPTDQNQVSKSNMESWVKSAGNLKENQNVCLDQLAWLMGLIVELKLPNEGYRSFACLVSSLGTSQF